jgi:hypothetical protein
MHMPAARNVLTARMLVSEDLTLAVVGVSKLQSCIPNIMAVQSALSW